jgi:hypothetical protein
MCSVQKQNKEENVELKALKKGGAVGHPYKRDG